MKRMKSMLAAALLMLGAGHALADPARSAIDLAGNAYVTTVKPGATEIITPQGLSHWTRASSVTSLWFWIEQPGSAALGLDAGLAGSRSSTVRVTVAGQSFEVALRKGARKVHEIARVALPAGYVRVDLQGVAKDGTEFGTVHALTVASDVPTAYASDSENYYWSRRGPSVHLAYQVPADTEYFYSELTVPHGQDKVGSYYMANGFSGGYFGIQVNSPSERRVLFSVWDAASGERTKLVSKGAGVNHNPFGGEGTGGQSYLFYNWVAGTTYRFLTRVRPDGAGSTEYSAWFFAPEQGNWRYMATWTRPATSSWYSGAHAFLENFLDTHGYLGRQADYGNQWARSTAGLWSEITSARLTGDATAVKRQRLDFAGGARGAGFYLQNGGFGSQTVPLNQTFTRPANGTAPALDPGTLPLR